jgi:hypothetical protein
MTSLAVILATILIGQAVCHPEGKSHLRWSEPMTVHSPNCEWDLQVVPNTSGDGADVVVRNVADKTSTVLFALTRDAEAHWGPGGNSLFIEDQEYENNSNVRFVRDLHDLRSYEVQLQLDHILRQNAKSATKPSEEISRFRPELLSWTNSQLVVMLQFVTIPKFHDGPAAAHCIGYEINPSKSIVTRALSDAELLREYGRVCTWLFD